MIYTCTYLSINEDMAERRFLIPACSPNLLYIRLKALGHNVVDDGMDIRLVEAHTKHDCGHYNPQPPYHECQLNPFQLSAQQLFQLYWCYQKSQLLCSVRPLERTEGTFSGAVSLSVSLPAWCSATLCVSTCLVQ